MHFTGSLMDLNNTSSINIKVLQLVQIRSLYRNVNKLTSSIRKVMLEYCFNQPAQDTASESIVQTLGTVHLKSGRGADDLGGGS